MLLNPLRLMATLFPFIKEVFIQSSEERRIWVGRMIVIFILVGSLNWIYHLHVLAKVELRDQEIGHLRQQVSGVQASLARAEAAEKIYADSLKTKQQNYERLYDEYKIAKMENEDLKEDLKSATTELEKLKHSLDGREKLVEKKNAPAKPVEKNVKKTTTTHPKSERQEDRLGGLYE